MYLHHFEYFKSLAKCEQVENYPQQWLLTSAPNWVDQVAHEYEALEKEVCIIFDETNAVRKMVFVHPLPTPNLEPADTC
jgi:hypothetical protein